MTIARIAAALLSLLLLAAVPIRAQQQINYTNMFIRLNEETSYGLQKLTSAERERLNGVFGSITARLNDNLRNSALAYLKSQGWGEFEVTGTEMLKLDPSGDAKTYLVARNLGISYSLEPMSVSSFMPGTYLGRVDSTECRLMNVQGGVVLHRVRRTGPAAPAGEQPHLR